MITILFYECHFFLLSDMKCVVNFTYSLTFLFTRYKYNPICVIFISLSLHRFRTFYRQPSSTFGENKSNRANDEPVDRSEFGLSSENGAKRARPSGRKEKPRDGPGANVYRAKPRMYERVNHRCGDGRGKLRVRLCSGRTTKPEAITLSRLT